MRLKPETLAAHRARHDRREPRQLELPLPSVGHNSRRYADICPRCRCVHTNEQEAEHCRQANAQREQY
jgi:hypothetical protein